MNSRQKIYADYLHPQISRVLSQMDRRPFSSTYGCFDRKYWHQRISDFPSASLQQGVELLAHLHQNESREGVKVTLLQWIEASVQYTFHLQKWDGSFDEWYFNERGWAGPTAYIVNSLYEAFAMTGSHWRASTVSLLKALFANAGECLSNFEEEDVLANHQALAMLALFQIYKVTGDARHLDSYEKIKLRFLEGFCRREGWTLEYDGADPGYQTATISFLARLHSLNHDPEVLEWAKPQLNFCSYFVFPDNSYARGLGSRSTSNIFFFGLEYWSQYVPIAGEMANRLLRGMVDNKNIGSHQQEDHYLIYRMPELFKAMNMATEISEQRHLPCDKNDVNQLFENSGYVFKRHGSLYIVIDGRFGGRSVVFNTRTRKLLFQESDIFLQTSNGNVMTSGHCSARTHNDKNTIKVETYFKKLKLPVFTPLKFIGFRLFFLLLGWHPILAKKMKKLIRGVLMFSGSSGSQRVQRLWVFDDIEVTVSTSVNGVSSSKTLFVGKDLPSRYVPQSNYCLDVIENNVEINDQHQWIRKFSCVE